MLKMDEQAWQIGFDAGRLGKPLESCPYPPESAEAWAWSSGYIEGKTKPLGSVPSGNAGKSDDPA